MACPWEVVWPDVGDPMLLVNLEPAPQDVLVGGSSDEAPASGGFVNTAVEAKEQEDVASADALLVQVPLCDTGLAEHASPPLPGGAVFSMTVRVEVEVRVEMDSVPPVRRPPVMPATTVAMSTSPC